MSYNRAVVDVKCLAAGTTNDANETEQVPKTRFPNVGGRLRALSGRELEVAQQIRANINWEFICMQPGIEADDFLCQQGRGRKLNVERVLPNENETKFRVLCSERV